MLLKVKNAHYGEKDKVKAKPCNKFIGRGSSQSSTQYYADNLPKDIVNCGDYTDTDIVFVSVEGNRRGRLTLDYVELYKAVSKRVRFVSDNKYNRNRHYNIGERELASYLVSRNYIPENFKEGAIWKHKEPTQCTGCNKGYGSVHDGLCRYCRKNLVPNHILKKHHLNRADGVSLHDVLTIKPDYLNY